MKWIPMIVGVCMFMAALMASCNDDTTRVGIGEGGIVTSVAVEPSVASPGDTLLLTITVMNWGSETYEHEFGCIQQFGYTIDAPEGEGSVHDPCLVNPAMSHLVIPAGESKIIEMRVCTNRAGCIGDCWPLSEDVLHPGLYRIRGGMLNGEEHWGEDYFILR